MLNSEPYVHALQNPDEDIRCEALNALLSKGMPSAVELFIRVADDPSPRVREAVVTGLGRFGNPCAVDVLLKALQDPVPKIRAEAAYAVAQFRDERSIPGILAVLRSSEAMDRVVALMGLSFFPHQDFSDILQEALGEEEADVRNAAQAVLERFVDFYHIRPLSVMEPPPTPESGKWIAYEEQFQEILDIDPDTGVDRLLGILEREGDVAERVRMVRALACLDDPGILIVLVQCTEDADPDVRRAAVDELGHQDDPLALEAIERMLQDPLEQVRIDALFAYARKKPAGMVNRFQQMLISESSERVRETVLYKLAKHDYAKAEHFLRSDLESANKEISLRAAVLLAEHNDVNARNVLWNSLNDTDEWARALAIYGMGKLGDNTALMRLVEALQDEDSDVRIAAAESLGNLGDPQALAPLRDALYDVYPAVRETVSESLARLESQLRGIAV